MSSRKTDITAGEERQQILVSLFKYDIWDERLLSDTLFGKTVTTVLTPRERFVMEMKIDGRSDNYIANVLKQRSPKSSFAYDTVGRMKSDIKRKLKDGFNTRVPGWVKGKIKTEKEEHEVRDFYDKHPEFLEEE